MSTDQQPSFGLDDDAAAEIGTDAATRIRTFRLIVQLSQRLRTLMDQRLRSDDLTTQQAALITVVDMLDGPTLSAAAAGLGSSHQNVKQLASSLERKGFMRIEPDPADRRSRRLRLTDANRALWERRSAADQDAVLEWFSGLTEDEAATLFALLLRLRSSISRAALPALGEG